MTRPRVLVTRPLPDGERTALRVAARGYEPVIEPLIAVRWNDSPPLAFDGVQAVAFTSANGVRALARRGPVPPLPVWAVGEATAAAARAAGLAPVHAAAGDVTSLAGGMACMLDPGAGAVLHVAGSHVAGDLAGALAAAGFTVRRAVLYEAVEADALSGAALAALGAEGLAAALFFSPRTAGVFVKLAHRAGLTGRCRGVEALCLSPACAAAARGEPPVPWRAVRAAGSPAEDSLLALLPDRSGA
jgi:uroporphyrinogen-III synthase